MKISKKRQEIMSLQNLPDFISSEDMIMVYDFIVSNLLKKNDRKSLSEYVKGLYDVEV